MDNMMVDLLFLLPVRLTWREMEKLKDDTDAASRALYNYQTRILNVSLELSGVLHTLR